MRIPFLGLEITRTKHVGTLSSPDSRGWWPLVHESFPGAWQQNVTLRMQDVTSYSTVWACVTLIASDISKLWVRLIEESSPQVWTPTENTAYSPVLEKPNHYQTHLQFFEYWMLSKLLHGNTYVLKERNNRGGTERGNVSAHYILDPQRVKPLISPMGEVFYQVNQDYLSGVDENAPIFPASEIMHDRMSTLFHPLVGLSPIYACGVNALQALKIQENSTHLFANGSQPGGVLTAPHQISHEVAERIRQHWESNYAGQSNVGKVVVLGDGLEYKPMTMTAVDAQLIDQLKWGDERICACFHVPGYMVGIGPAPPYTDIQSLTLQYYNQALQVHIENIEQLLVEGLALPRTLGVEFDLDALLRMDTKTQVDNATKGILGGLFKPNEERAKFNRTPVEGGDTVYLQQQQYSLEALNKRDQAPPIEESEPIDLDAVTDESKRIATEFLAA